MAQALKDIYNEDRLADMVDRFTLAYPAFDAQAFRGRFSEVDWEQLSLRQRHAFLADNLYQTLNLPYAQVCQVLADIHQHCQGFTYLFLPDLVARYGLADLDNSLDILGLLTTGSTAEFAIRPFLEQNFERTYERMLVWAQSPNEHHRRLASEGLRTRLPWGKRLPHLFQVPDKTMVILDMLHQDPSLYVRKSVANNLNDLSKDFPELVLEFARRHGGKSKEADWIIKQGTRSLVKAGHAETLSLLGYGQEVLQILEAHLQLNQDRYQMGDRLNLTYDLTAKTSQPTRLRLALEVTFAKAAGKTSPKIFFLKDCQLEGETSLSGHWTYHWEDKTTRKHYSGLHKLRLLVNSQPVAEEDCEVIIQEERTRNVE